MAKFIAFSGKKQTGKSTSADLVREILSAETDYNICEFAFAKPLKDLVHNVYGISNELLWGTDKQKETLTHILWDGFHPDIRLKYFNESQSSEDFPYSDEPLPRSGPMTVRELLQVLGTDVFREQVYQNTWAEAPFRQDWKENDLVLIPDCRFPNEWHLTLMNDGTVIRLERDRSEKMESDTHKSETALDTTEFQFAYRNNGTMEELRYWLRGVLELEGYIL